MSTPNLFWDALIEPEFGEHLAALSAQKGQVQEGFCIFADGQQHCCRDPWPDMRSILKQQMSSNHRRNQRGELHLSVRLGVIEI